MLYVYQGPKEEKDSLKKSLSVKLVKRSLLP